MNAKTDRFQSDDVSDVSVPRALIETWGDPSSIRALHLKSTTLSGTLPLEGFPPLKQVIETAPFFSFSLFHGLSYSDLESAPPPPKINQATSKSFSRPLGVLLRLFRVILGPNIMGFTPALNFTDIQIPKTSQPFATPKSEALNMISKTITPETCPSEPH
ncbi:hypothetical protein BDN72DRAFT_906695 [Pluteus cervinus]|uniref:Uncharacterized protein n=1 Tax=Pluteus cervinus TaxID=181527 RepID=A0ACD2ZY37_9AGAR|nr:hypothetical protein BDN72DRAFT_906695 [Pluteus cervinus]